MAGWFNKKIQTVDDLKGLKMRIPGLGGKVLAKAGGTPDLLSGGEIFSALERGAIDAGGYGAGEQGSGLGFDEGRADRGGEWRGRFFGQAL